MKEYVLNPELQAYIPPLQSGEAEALRRSIAAEGCRDPIVVWRGTIIDGHHRYQICRELGIEPPTVDRTEQLPDLRAVKAWMYENCIARRNLSPDQIAVLAARDGYEPPAHVRGRFLWANAVRLVASAPAELIDRVVREPSYTVTIAHNDLKRRTAAHKPRVAAAVRSASEVGKSALRTAKGTPTRAGLTLARSVRDVLAPVLEAYLATGHDRADVIAIVRSVAEELCRES